MMIHLRRRILGTSSSSQATSCKRFLYFLFSFLLPSRVEMRGEEEDEEKGVDVVVASSSSRFLPAKTHRLLLLPISHTHPEEGE